MPVPDATTNQGVTSSWIDTNLSNQVVSTVLAAGKPAGTEGQLISVTDTDRGECYDSGGWTRIFNWSSAGRTSCRLRRVATQAVLTATDTPISWDTEDADTDGFIAVTGDTITIPAGLPGVYLLTTSLAWASSPGTNNNLRYEIGGTTGDYRVSCGSSTVSYQAVNLCSAITLAATNTIKVRCYQGSGSSINITAEFQLYRLFA